METVQLKEGHEARNRPGRIFDASGYFERCGRCGDIHLHGWSCYHCTVIKRMSRRRFVNPLNRRPSRKYLATTPANCKHCVLPIWERTRGQTLHPECKAIWQDRKRKVFRTNQLLWFIREKGHYMLDGKPHSVNGLTDEAILTSIGQVLPEDVVCVKKPGGGFRFRGVEFSWPRDRYPWAPWRYPSPFSNKKENEARERRDRKLLGLQVSTRGGVTPV